MPSRFPSDRAAAPAGLISLVGAQRAVILEMLLAGPASCGSLAKALFMAPGGITHHLRVLERAGLARRTRAGREVMVNLSARGRALLDLYDAVRSSERPASSRDH
jgi:DNA-binding transcriptional ArsR family regulator